MFRATAPVSFNFFVFQYPWIEDYAYLDGHDIIQILPCNQRCKLWKSAGSPAGDLPPKSGTPDQILKALIAKEWPF